MKVIVLKKDSDSKKGINYVAGHTFFFDYLSHGSSFIFHDSYTGVDYLPQNSFNEFEVDISRFKHIEESLISMNTRPIDAICPRCGHRMDVCNQWTNDKEPRYHKSCSNGDCCYVIPTFSGDCGEAVVAASDFLIEVYKRINPTDQRKTVVTLCGSTRLESAFRELEETLTMRGEIVLTCGVWPHSNGIELSEEHKQKLDELHKRKIDKSDYIYVVNVGGYIGESTASEIRYAAMMNKGICYLEPAMIKPNVIVKEVDITPYAVSEVADPLEVVEQVGFSIESPFNPRPEVHKVAAFSGDDIFNFLNDIGCYLYSIVEPIDDDINDQYLNDLEIIKRYIGGIKRHETFILGRGFNDEVRILIQRYSMMVFDLKMKKISDHIEDMKKYSNLVSTLLKNID